jgi:hypothetical protein
VTFNLGKVSRRASARSAGLILTLAGDQPGSAWRMGRNPRLAALEVRERCNTLSLAKCSIWRLKTRRLEVMSRECRFGLFFQ